MHVLETQFSFINICYVLSEEVAFLKTAFLLFLIKVLLFYLKSTETLKFLNCFNFPLVKSVDTLWELEFYFTFIEV